MLIKFLIVANLIIFSPDPVIWMINWQPAGRLGEAWNKLTAVDVICYSRGKLWAPSEKFNTQGLFWQAKELDPTTQPVQGVKLRTTIKIPQQAILGVVTDHLTNISSSSSLLTVLKALLPPRPIRCSNPEHGTLNSCTQGGAKFWVPGASNPGRCGGSPSDKGAPSHRIGNLCRQWPRWSHTPLAGHPPSATCSTFCPFGLFLLFFCSS